METAGDSWFSEVFPKAECWSNSWERCSRDREGHLKSEIWYLLTRACQEADVLAGVSVWAGMTLWVDWSVGISGWTLVCRGKPFLFLALRLSQRISSWPGLFLPYGKPCSTTLQHKMAGLNTQEKACGCSEVPLSEDKTSNSKPKTKAPLENLLLCGKDKKIGILSELLSCIPNSHGPTHGCLFSLWSNNSELVFSLLSHLIFTGCEIESICVGSLWLSVPYTSVEGRFFFFKGSPSPEPAARRKDGQCYF